MSKSSSLIAGKIIFYLMMPSLLIDSITGYMLIDSPDALSLSQLYRSGMLVALVLWLACFWLRGFLVVSFVLLIHFVFMTWHGLSATSLASVAMDLRFNLSVLMHLVFFVFLYGYLNIIRLNLIQLRWLDKAVQKIVIFSFVVISINIILGIFGIGYSTLATYVQGGSDDEGGMAGGKGFFFAGNDLSSAFLIVSGMLLIRTWPHCKMHTYLLFSGILMALSMMLLTKAVILGMLMLITVIPIVMSKLVSGSRFHLRPLIPLLFGLGLGTFIFFWLISINSTIIVRSIFLYESRDIATAILTGRNYFFAMAMEVIDTHFGAMDYLFGLGWSGFLDAMRETMGREQRVEIDYVDVFMVNGLSGLAIVIVMWSAYVKFAWREFRFSTVAKAVLFINFLLIGLAATSGHVLFSAMNGLFIALLNILPLIDRNVRLLRRPGV